jgi:hypothetical protein
MLYRFGMDVAQSEENTSWNIPTRQSLAKRKYKHRTKSFQEPLLPQTLKPRKRKRAIAKVNLAIFGEIK